MRTIDITTDWVQRWVAWNPERYQNGATAQYWHCSSGETVLETYEAVRKTAMETIPNCPPIELYDCLAPKSHGRKSDWAGPVFRGAAYCLIPTLMRDSPECCVVSICLADGYGPFYSAMWRAVRIPHDSLTLTMDWDVYYGDELPSYEKVVVSDKHSGEKVLRPVGYTEAWGARNREAKYLCRDLQRMILATLHIPGL